MTGATAGPLERGGHLLPYRLAIGTVAATWLLLVIGGLVHPTGSSLACPDWIFLPTCHGAVLPADWSGGVLYEHGHRMWASMVGILTVLLALTLQRAPGIDRTTRRLGFAAIVLVAVQGTLGGVTVLVGLSWVLSTLHLTLANIFFCLLIYLAARARPFVLGGARQPGAHELKRSAVGGVAALVLAQILLGGLVRHLGAGGVCLSNWLGCADHGPWPQTQLEALHMAHRALGFVTLGAIVVVMARAARAARAAGRDRLARLCKAPVHAATLQVALGLLALATNRRLELVTAHTAVAGLVLATVMIVYIGHGPIGARMAGPEPEGAPA